METSESYSFRVLDFHVSDESELSDGDGPPKDCSEFVVKMFAVDEQGTTYCIRVEGYSPFFYVMVGDHWDISRKNLFVEHLKQKVGAYYRDSIVNSRLTKRKKLYGFDNGKEHKFVQLEFANTQVMRKVSNFWYTSYDAGHTLLPDGYFFQGTKTRLYESNIPPLLRLFHIRDISPSGWVQLSKAKASLRTSNKPSSCDIDLACHYKDLVPQNAKEARVPYKIMSFDIEASSSHGDFPLPVKTYKKLATNIVEFLEKQDCSNWSSETYRHMLRNMILSAFGLASSAEQIDTIDLVYPKEPPKAPIPILCDQWLSAPIRTIKANAANNSALEDAFRLEACFDKMFKELHQKPEAVDGADDSDDDDNSDHGGEGNDGFAMVVEEAPHFKRNRGASGVLKRAAGSNGTVVEMLCDQTLDRNVKIDEINLSLISFFPKLEGDKVTFIGSTFMDYGNKEPHMNHCIVLNTCASLPPTNNNGSRNIIECYPTEREVLLAWKDLVQRENPDMVIGYNIFGFDYEFLFRRAEENDCVQEFLKLSRNNNEICGNFDPKTKKYSLEESTIQIASGQHDLKYIKMNGRLQVDLYNFYRREVNLVSYKLDYVAGHFIGDYVKQLRVAENQSEGQEETDYIIETSNLTGLLVGSFIHFEEIGHSTEYYLQGAKFRVVEVDLMRKSFVVRVGGDPLQPDFSKKVRWCLAKDDVTPKDIFRMTNGSDEDRAIIAKYCLQDCNLVHYLFNKSDILTGFIEMAKLCSVPINFLVMRGQGIKLFSFISKKCREKRTLMPVIDKGDPDDGYEGAIVLPPKCDLYLDNPVACVDYASLYPSSMISENLSHDSKVWTREYDLAGNLVEETGEKDAQGRFIYDQLPGYEYIDIEYDTYKYLRACANKKPVKTVVGRKICRFAVAQNEDAIMPSVLKELLKARKDTRKLIPLQTDDFMKQVLEQRQLSCKLTANSLYGQCGAKTSAFYEKDIASCTTATGRKLLTYAKRVIEECYKDRICPTLNYGEVRTRAEYIYGDTDSVFFTFNLETPSGEKIRGKPALEITIELAQQAGHLASSFLKGPHDLEYEKTFMPFCLLSKKRYVGMLYETDPNKGKRKEMGIVLKRRDNAPIVKDVYGGIIDILMKKQNIGEAITFLRNSLQTIIDEECPMEKLVITKSLRSGYKNPQSIAHKVLADRMAARDPGNKPGPGDRIPFVYIHTSNKNALQGEKIETPAFVREQGLKMDYSFYITNQIMKPVQQVFSLVLYKVWETLQPDQARNKIETFQRNLRKYEQTLANDVVKLEKKTEELRCAEIKKVLFDPYLRVTNNTKLGMQALTNYQFTATTSNNGSTSKNTVINSSSNNNKASAAATATAKSSSTLSAPAKERKSKIKIFYKADSAATTSSTG